MVHSLAACLLTKFLVLYTVNAVFEGDPCEQGDAHRRDCVVCLCTMSNQWSCKRDICNDCNDGEVKQKDNYNYYCENGRWAYVPFLQLPKEQVVLPFGPCNGEAFKPDWPCNRCKCILPENVWECPLQLCREDTMLKSYSPKATNAHLDKLYGYFKYDGRKETCSPGEVREGDECNKCTCKEDIWWCKLKQCPEIIETDSIDADTLPDHLEIELPPGMKSIKEHEDDSNWRVCDPGKRYKKQCNTCTCSSDGTVETCTQYDCGKFGGYGEDQYESYDDEFEYGSTDEDEYEEGEDEYEEGADEDYDGSSEDSSAEEDIEERNYQHDDDQYGTSDDHDQDYDGKENYEEDVEYSEENYKDYDDDFYGEEGIHITLEEAEYYADDPEQYENYDEYDNEEKIPEDDQEEDDDESNEIDEPSKGRKRRTRMKRSNDYDEDVAASSGGFSVNLKINDEYDVAYNDEENIALQSEERDDDLDENIDYNIDRDIYYHPNRRNTRRRSQRRRRRRRNRRKNRRLEKFPSVPRTIDDVEDEDSSALTQGIARQDNDDNEESAENHTTTEPENALEVATEVRSVQEDDKATEEEERGIEESTVTQTETTTASIE